MWLESDKISPFGLSRGRMLPISLALEKQTQSWLIGDVRARHDGPAGCRKSRVVDMHGCSGASTPWLLEEEE